MSRRNKLLSKKRKIDSLDDTLEEVFELIDCHIDSASHLKNSSQNVQISSDLDKSCKSNEITPLNYSGTHIHISNKSLLNAISLLNGPTKQKKRKSAKHTFRRTCQEGYHHMFDQINWMSYAYTAKCIRHLVLHREWEHLKELLRVLMKQNKLLKNYVKELTYLYYLINADVINPMEVDEYFQLCFSSTGKSEFREFDIWYSKES